MLRILAVGALVAAAFGAPVADDPPAIPPPGGVVIDVVTVNGSGCPPGTAAVAIEPDNSAFELTFSQYRAEVGPSAQPLGDRRNCQFAMVVHVPQGYTYAIASSDYQGFASLAAGAGAGYRMRQYFQGQPATSWQQHVISGPYSAEVLLSTVPDVESLVWAPCGQRRILNIHTTIEVLPGTSDTRRLYSFASLDKATGFTFQWKRCDT